MDLVKDWKQIWLKEEQQPFEGWDFEYLMGRWESEPLPWDYRKMVKYHLNPTDLLLDMGTGGGEMLLSFQHPYQQTSATEGYLPNYQLCLKTLSELGINVKFVAEDDQLDFPDQSFDLVMNRHESFDAAEVWRVLKPNGIFITQQVGGSNNRDLARKLIGDENLDFKHDLQENIALLKKESFHILQRQEAYPILKFYDVGALVYFAKIIQWEFPNFSVEDNFAQLLACQQEVDQNGFVSSTEHRFIIVAKKTEE